MVAKEPVYRPIEKGLRGTDNCPVCGQAMKKRDVQVFTLGDGRVARMRRLTCEKAGHSASILLPVISVGKTCRLAKN